MNLEKMQEPEDGGGKHRKKNAGFMHPLILIASSLLYKNSGNSSSITSDKTVAMPVLLLIPKLQVSVPGQEVTSAVLPKPAAANLSSFNIE